MGSRGGVKENCVSVFQWNSVTMYSSIMALLCVMPLFNQPVYEQHLQNSGFSARPFKGLHVLIRQGE